MPSCISDIEECIGPKVRAPVKSLLRFRRRDVVPKGEATSICAITAQDSLPFALREMVIMVLSSLFIRIEDRILLKEGESCQGVR
jgi:hypothetical protein